MKKKKKINQRRGRDVLCAQRKTSKSYHVQTHKKRKRKRGQ